MKKLNKIKDILWSFVKINLLCWAAFVCCSLLLVLILYHDVPPGERDYTAIHWILHIIYFFAYHKIFTINIENEKIDLHHKDFGLKQTVVDFYGIPGEKVPVVFNGVDLSRCMVKESYTSDGRLKLLHVGRFNEQKNHAGLLEAFRLFLEKHPDSELRLLGEGELLEETVEQAEKLGIQAQVQFCGSTGNVYPYLHDADIFLLPSRYEGMPMTIIEAMGTGLPIVAANVGGIPDMIEDGKSGLLVSCDPEKVCAACLRLAEDSLLRERMGKLARSRSQRFSADYMTRRYLEEYNK